MHAKPINPNFAVSEQITVAQIAEVKAAGFKSIICNRPDGEGYDQPDFSEIEQAAKAAGLQARYIPVNPGMMSHADVQAFAEAIKTLPAPVLAFCRSGARSTALWNASQR
jgi:sulfide:quinone oxidoreductase